MTEQMRSRRAERRLDVIEVNQIAETFGTTPSHLLSRLLAYGRHERDLNCPLT